MAIYSSVVDLHSDRCKATQSVAATNAALDCVMIFERASALRDVYSDGRRQTLRADRLLCLDSQLFFSYSAYFDRKCVFSWLLEITRRHSILKLDGLTILPRRRATW
jgi:hypothetical protein